LKTWNESFLFMNDTWIILSIAAIGGNYD